MDKTAAGARRPARGSRAPARARGLAALPMANAVLSRLVARRLRAAGMDLKSILKQVGITQRQIDDPDERLPASSQVAFLEAAAAALDDDLLGFRLAQGVDCRGLGLLYYVFASSTTLDEAIRRCARYSRVANEAVALRASSKAVAPSSGSATPASLVTATSSRWNSSWRSCCASVVTRRDSSSFRSGSR